MKKLLVLGGVAAVTGFVVFKMVKRENKVGNARSLSSINGYSGDVTTAPAGPVIQRIAGQGPGSGGTAKAGNANQPWYNGAVVAGAGLAFSELSKGLAGLFTSDGGVNDESGDNGPLIDETDITSGEEEYGEFSESAYDDTNTYSETDFDGDTEVA